MKISYDPKCEELAKYFLEDETSTAAEAAVTALAGVIQLAIEEWMEEHTPGFEAQQEPEDYSGQGEEK